MAARFSCFVVVVTQFYQKTGGHCYFIFKDIVTLDNKGFDRKTGCQT